MNNRPADPGEALVELARRALTEEHLREAASLIGRALRCNPGRFDWLDVAEEIRLRAQNPLELLPDDAAPPASDVALRAFFRARAGDFVSAFEELLWVFRAAPGAGYFQWMEGWLGQRAEPSAVPLDDFVKRLLPLINDTALTSDLNLDEPAVRADLLTLISCCSLLEEQHGFDENAWTVSLALSLLHRRLGDFDAADRYGMSAHGRAPSAATGLAVAHARRAAGDLVGASDMFAEALSCQPGQTSILLDWADCLLEAGAFDAAVEKYEEVLERHPDNEWARASACAARALSGDVSATDEFRRWAASNSTHPRAALVDALLSD